MTGDELQVVTDLYERHAGAVHRYALRRSDSETADEVTAQVFTVAWRRRSELPSEPLPWLYGVARRVLADQRRAEARRRGLREHLRRELVEEVSPELSDRGLMDALRGLSQMDREVLLLRYWEDLEPGQVAVVVGCSGAAVAVRLHRARLRLRNALHPVGLDLDDDQHEHSCVARTEPT